MAIERVVSLCLFPVFHQTCFLVGLKIQFLKMSHLTLEGSRGSVYCPVGTGTAAIVGPKLSDIASVQVGAVGGKTEACLAPKSN